MTSLALRGLAARKLRSALTATAILLGVAMVAGTYVLTDQIRERLRQHPVAGRRGHRRGHHAEGRLRLRLHRAADDRRGPRGKVDAVDGVDAAYGQVGANGRLVVDGKVVDTAGAPSFVIGAAPSLFNPLDPVTGRQPRATGEIAVLEQTAKKQHLEVGDRVGVTTREGVKRFRVVGVFSFGEGGSSLGGTSLVTIPTRRAPAPLRLRGPGVEHRGDRRERRDRRTARAAAAAALPGVAHGPDRRAERPGERRRDQRQHRRLPDAGAAGVRRRRAAGRRLHHLQHLLDHGRATHPRVRGAALPGSDAAAGDGRDADRGAGSGCVRLRGRDRRRRRGSRSCSPRCSTSWASASRAADWYSSRARSCSRSPSVSA